MRETMAGFRDDWCIFTASGVAGVLVMVAGAMVGGINVLGL